jgi:ribosomal protein S21
LLQVTIREGESQEGLLSRFQKMVQRDGVLREARQRKHFISEREKMRAAQRKAARRNRRAQARQR